MMNNSENMFWGDINDIKRFTENKRENKNKKARKTSSIILAGVQLMENYIKGLKKMSAYDAASTIVSDANWIQKSEFDEYVDKDGQKHSINIGTIYYIDYGNSFKGELAYFHYGLCVGKRNGKVLVVPITSGEDYFSECFHPTNNPNHNKKYRQGLLSEGFGKDCVLMINDTKYISAGRIEKTDAIIHNEVLCEIQMQVFQVEFPQLFQDYKNAMNKAKKLNDKLIGQRDLIVQLKNENNHLKQKLEPKETICSGKQQTIDKPL